jgi:hypothetical protein
MMLPQIYEDAIDCFCPRTAWEMQRLVEKYLATGTEPYINKRMGQTPCAALRLIFSNISLTSQLNRSIKPLNQVEEAPKGNDKEQTKKETLSPAPPIIGRSKREKEKENAEECPPPPPARARVRQTSFHKENNSLPEGVTNKGKEKEEVNEEAQALIDYYNGHIEGSKLAKVFAPYPDLLDEAAKALRLLGPEKAHKVIDVAVNTPFLNGENKYGFIGSFNWIFRDRHYYKILNHEYDEHERIDFEQSQRLKKYDQFIDDELRGRNDRHVDDSIW